MYSTASVGWLHVRTCRHSPYPFREFQLRTERTEVLTSQSMVTAQGIHKQKKCVCACHGQAEIPKHRLNEHPLTPTQFLSDWGQRANAVNEVKEKRKHPHYHWPLSPSTLMKIIVIKWLLLSALAASHEHWKWSYEGNTKYLDTVECTPISLRYTRYTCSFRCLFLSGRNPIILWAAAEDTKRWASWSTGRSSQASLWSIATQTAILGTPSCLCRLSVDKRQRLYPRNKEGWREVPHIVPTFWRNIWCICTDFRLWIQNNR